METWGLGFGGAGVVIGSLLHMMLTIFLYSNPTRPAELCFRPYYLNTEGRPGVRCGSGGMLGSRFRDSDSAQDMIVRDDIRALR